VKGIPPKKACPTVAAAADSAICGLQIKRQQEENMGANDDRIRQRAYEIWEQEGRPQGDDLKHWLQAFQEPAAGAEAGGRPSRKLRSSKAAATDVLAKPIVAGKTKGGAQSVPATTPPPKPTKPAGVTKH
jgi:hypothetical protein